jgi:hypothetical protein
MDEIGSFLSTCGRNRTGRGKMDKATYERGMAMRRRVLGDD